ncbi:ISL3 family transposase [Candidatus Poriferisocius sp.]|uniref:ISL3 family transposase n=1 Tax=Candidatus Poriferisocius sp. TaxID=3101276 RepID=UPI003B014BB0
MWLVVWRSGWHTVWSAVEPELKQRADDPDRVGATFGVGFDETVMNSATRRRRCRYITAAVDTATGQVIDVFDGRDANDLHKWVSAQPRGWRQNIRVVCCDPHEGYRKAIRALIAQGLLPAGTRLATDPFHIVRLANQAITRARQRTQQQTTGHRGRKGDPLYGIRKLLLMAAERLDPRGWQRLHQALKAGDPCDEVLECWQAKEQTRSIFKTTNPQTAVQRLDDTIAYCSDPDAPPELQALAGTLNRWHTETITSVATATTNARTEAANAKIKDIKRKARGYTNIGNYRLRILVATGHKPHQNTPTTRIRTHKTPLKRE